GRGLPHRHVALENVFLDDAGKPKLSDFGLARLDPSSADADGADARADLYALGALLYEVVTGTPPGRSTETGKHPRFDEALARALSPNPGERFGRASEMSLALMLVNAGLSKGDASEVAGAGHLRLSVKDKCITLTLTPSTTAKDIEASMPELERM